MKTIITEQQARYFSEKGEIEFESLLSKEECSQILLALQRVALLRLKAKLLSRVSPQDLYRASRDVWREDPLLRQIVTGPKFSTPALALMGKKPIQLACDQWIPKQLPPLEPASLPSHLSFQGLACGALLSLEESIGSARFFMPERLPLFSGDQLLIAYAWPNAVYIRNENDPCNALLKRFGYAFGDRLIHALHPLFR